MKKIIKIFISSIGIAYFCYILVICFLHILLEKPFLELLAIQYLYWIGVFFFIIFLFGLFFEQENKDLI